MNTLRTRSSIYAITLLSFLLLFITACTNEKTLVVSMQGYTLENGSVFSITAAPTTWKLEGSDVVLNAFAYNNQIPGPLLKVKQGTTIFINFTNKIPMNTTIHWHGLRHKNKDDGVPGVTQDFVVSGQGYTYELQFPDSGLYWYHPHIREDIQQEKGLYGAILVEPDTEQSEVQEEVMILDDVLVEGNDFSPFSEKVTNFALMGRFGNELFVNGKVDYSFRAKQNDILRLYIVNVANVRPFNFSIEGADMAIVGTDLGFIEPFKADNVVIAPAERYIVDVVFTKPGNYKIMNKNPLKSYELGTIEVEEKTSEYNQPTIQADYDGPRFDFDKYKSYLNTEPDYEYRLALKMPMMEMPHMEDQEG